MAKIGFIGLGIMGSRMAANLQKNGVDLVIYNRTASKAETLLENGAAWANSPAELAGRVTVLFTMLSTPEAVRETALGLGGFLQHLAPGSLWADCSTVNPSFVREMAAAAEERGIRYVDAPVAGSKNPAETGQLVIYAGGDEADVAELQPYLAMVGRQTIHAGGHASGAALKMVNNLLFGAAMAVFAEGIALGQALGLSQELLFNTLISGPAVPAIVNGKRAKLEKGDYSPEFPMQWLQKDLHLAAVSAYEVHQPLPVVNAAKELYALAMREGLAEADFSAIYAFLNRAQS